MKPVLDISLLVIFLLLSIVLLSCLPLLFLEMEVWLEPVTQIHIAYLYIGYSFTDFAIYL